MMHVLVMLSVIRVKLNEGYFAKEQRSLLNMAANLRQKISSMQMFNPAKNQSINEQQQEWSQKVSAIGCLTPDMARRAVLAS